MSEYLALERQGQIATVRFTRPEKLNIMDRGMIAAIQETFDTLANEADLRAVIIIGSGRAFIGGADVNVMRELDPASARAFISSLHAALTAIRNLPVPVICAVNGYALGGGCELVAACDLRIAAQAAKFGMPEIKVGIPSVIEAAMLVPLIGLSRAAWLVYTGEMIDAAEAERIGLVSKIVADDTLESEALKLAEMLASYEPTAMRLQKELLRQWVNQGVEDSMNASIEFFSRTFTTNEPRNAMDAFLNRRKKN